MECHIPKKDKELRIDRLLQNMASARNTLVQIKNKPKQNEIEVIRLNDFIVKCKKQLKKMGYEA